MQISGTVENIKFRNEENGYTVAVVENDLARYTVVGCFPPVTEGSFVTCDGELVDNPKFGVQLKADSVKMDMPDTEWGIMKFLGSGIIHGIGPKRAQAIVLRFGKQTLSIMENWPERLAQVPGISSRTADNISHEFKKIKAAAEAVSFLVKGMSAVLAFRVFGVYGADTVAAISSNPYRMTDEVQGVGFVTADRMAKAIGIAPDSIFRIKAGIRHAMGELCERTGNTVCFKEEITDSTLTLLGLTDAELIKAGIDELTTERKIKEVECEGEPALMNDDLYSAERMSSAYLIQRNRELALEKVADVEDYIAHFEQLSGMKFHVEQKNAIKNAVNSGVCVITGGPGTGKTTILKCILGIFTTMKKKFTLLAPTGRAAKRMSESTGFPAYTIHRMLMHDSFLEEGLKTEAVIVDEFSMVDTYLLYNLLKIIPAGAKLIIVGDTDQLPSVGPGNVLADIIASGLIPVQRLSHIYRQSGNSMIVTAAHEINEGKCPDLSKKDSDFFFIKEDSASATADTVVSLVTSRLPKFLSVPPEKIQVLCPLKNGEAGSIALNARLREKLVGKPVKKSAAEDTEFSVGDKVMHTVNNYELEWTGETSAGKGVFNGDTGTVAEVFPNSGELVVRFDDNRIAIYNIEDRKELTLAYAVTVHKSQGSEYDAVVLPVFSANKLIMTRNLLYTGVTRAKRLVVIVGSEENLRRMISNDYVGKRYSMLRQFLIETDAKFDRLYGTGGQSL